jgi:hypothetical protein
MKTSVTLVEDGKLFLVKTRFLKRDVHVAGVIMKVTVRYFENFYKRAVACESILGSTHFTAAC